MRPVELNVSIGTDEIGHLARLLDFLKAGEQVASVCAQRQSEFVADKDRQCSKFLRRQSGQEQFHNRVFQGAEYWLSARGVRQQSNCEAFREYERRVLHALDQGHFSESLFAVQVMLESVGETVLSHLDAGMTRRRMGLQRIRRVILQQERAHHSFGGQQLQRWMRLEGVSQAQMRDIAEPYVSLGRQMLDGMDAVFAGLNQDKQRYWNHIENELPDWL